MKKDTTTILGLILLTCATRIPFATKHIVTHDSANFALALTDFNISMHRPQPPGYILYVGLGKLVNLLIGNANTSYVILSIFFSVLAVVLIYLLGKQFFNSRCGLISALFLLSSPVFWTLGELALSYVAIASGSLLVAYFAYKTVKGERQYALWLSLSLGVMSGLRQYLLPFLFPLWVMAMLSLKSWKETVRNALILTVVCLFWFVPLILLSGGLTNFRSTLGNHYQSGGASQFTSPKTFIYALMSSIWGLGAVVFALLLSIRAFKQIPYRSKLFRFATVWSAPILLLVFVVFIGNPGLILMFLPCLIVLSSAFAYRRFSRRSLTLTCFILLANVVLFFSVHPLSDNERVIGINTNRFKNFANFWALDYSNKGLRKREQIKETLDVIKKNFSPQTTAVAVSDASIFQPSIPWRLVYYHLPEFFSVKLQDTSQTTEIPSNIETVIWLMNKQDVDMDVVQTLHVQGKTVFFSPITDTLKMKHLTLFKNVGAFN
jgi:hypothetical protein